MSRTGYIYKIESPSGKVYIGKTFNIDARIKKYKYKSCKSQNKLYASINKYGFENHNVEILAEISCCSNDLLSFLEVAYIRKYNSFKSNHGMNLTSGGDGSYALSDATKSKISNARKGMKFTEEHRMNLSKSKKGFTLTENQKENLRGFNNHSSHTVLNTENGVFYGSIREAAKYQCIPSRTLSRHLNRSDNKTNMIKV